ncbi:MAG: DUF397 domain-containing protein [Pseudonocardiales bacterium]|nr:DUF397 domain-containing protein [Pseudonocardiales bacterium]MBV9730967.1 DUF397 domain-containing protein [Pseudonocardiales bacterium]
MNLAHPDLVHVRDSKNHGIGPTITATGRQWAMLLDQITCTAGSTTP